MTASALRDGAVPRMTRFSFGMGLDSACIALRWLEEPESRDGIDLDTVTLSVAMTGDEYDETRRMMDIGRPGYWKVLNACRWVSSAAYSASGLPATRSQRAAVLW